MIGDFALGMVIFGLGVGVAVGAASALQHRLAARQARAPSPLPFGILGACGLLIAGFGVFKMAPLIALFL